MCYTSSYGLDDVFAKAKKLDWVKEVKPDVPSRGNGWGKNSTEYHLSEDNDYRIQIKVDGVLAHEWKWVNQSEAGKKTVPDKYWKEFLKNAEATRKSGPKKKEDQKVEAPKEKAETLST